MGVQQTSLEAYMRISAEGVKDTQIKAVYAYILSSPWCTDLEISEAICFPINVVTARRNELQKRGLIKPHGAVLNVKTNHYAMTWEAI